MPEVLTMTQSVAVKQEYDAGLATKVIRASSLLTLSMAKMQFGHSHIHPFSVFHYLALIVTRGAGTPWTSRQFTARPHRKTNNYWHCTHTYGQFRLWEEAGEPVENPRRLSEYMQTPHRNSCRSGDRTCNLLGCVTTVLTVASLFCALAYPMMNYLLCCF